MTDEMDGFDWEFYTGEDAHVPDELKEKARDRMLALTTGHTDMIGASVAVERPAVRETDFIYEARVVAYVTPENKVAVKKADSAEMALDAALDAVERQVRDMRERLGKPWQQPCGAED